MSYLQLCQSVQELSGTTGSPQITTVGATGEWGNICNWVADEYIKIQNARNDWEWMESDVSFNTVANQQSYSPYTTTFLTGDNLGPGGVGLLDFRRWKITSTTGECAFRLYLAAIGTNNETFLDAQLGYAAWRDYYLFGSRRTTSARPISIVVDPHKNLLFGLQPNDVYTVTGIYYTLPTILINDTDTPAFPPEYHAMIVHRALVRYGYFYAAPEIVAEHKDIASDMMDQMLNEQLPDISLPDPLA
jgi:hypothetical protein